jgi:hypothetical protein
MLLQSILVYGLGFTTHPRTEDLSRQPAGTDGGDALCRHVLLEGLICQGFSGENPRCTWDRARTASLVSLALPWAASAMVDTQTQLHVW